MADAERLRQWLRAGARAVGRERGRLDAINVFPVADSDTGTNLYLTLTEGNRAVAELPQDAAHAEVVAAFADGALRGARGNSGVIVSQYLSAFLTAVDEAGGLDQASPDAVRAALEAAADASFSAVGEPVEGTVLSVARAAAEGARGSDADSVLAVVLAAVAAARTELAATTENLAEARRAGVVDAGAAGLALQIEALAEALGGADQLSALDEVPWEVQPVADPDHDHADHGEHSGGAFEVMFVAQPRAHGLGGGGRLKSALAKIGDSVAVTSVGDLWQAHVHTDDPALALALAEATHAPQAIVRHIASTHAADREASGIVALTTCPGLASVLASGGAVVVVAPEPAELEPAVLERAVVDASGSHAVVVAGAPHLRAVARALAVTTESPRIEVVDCDSEPQLVAAAAAAAVGGTPNAALMSRAAAACTVGRSTPDAVAVDLDRMVVPGVELATIILGRGVSGAVGESAAQRVEQSHPGVEVVVIEGGQRVPAVLLGVEAGSPS